MKNPKISVVTVSYNAVEAIEETMLSVINQTYQNIEYIIIDGGSKDGTVDIINKYRDKIAYFVSEPDKGIYDAMNKGINVSTGEWINFMNSGDKFYDVSTLSEVFNDVSHNSDIIFGDTLICGSHNIRYIEYASPFYEHLPLHNNAGFNHQSTFVRTALAKCNPFDTHYKLAADYNMIISLFRQHAVFQQTHRIIAIYSLDGKSDISRKAHIYETLMIDNPNKILCNKVKSEIIYIRTRLLKRIKEVVFRINSSLGEKLMRIKYRV